MVICAQIVARKQGQFSVSRESFGARADSALLAIRSMHVVYRRQHGKESRSLRRVWPDSMAIPVVAGFVRIQQAKLAGRRQQVYPDRVSAPARELQQERFLLEEDATAIQKAAASRQLWER